MTQWPSISIIVPTYQREAVLCSTLADVLKQDYPDYEVIVVDQTRTHQPETQAYLDSLIEADQIQYYPLSWASLPGARNYGVERSRGDIILFIDDDVELPEGYLQAHAKVFLEQPTVGAVAGRVFDRMKLGDDPNLTIEQLPPRSDGPRHCLVSHRSGAHYPAPAGDQRPRLQYVLSARGLCQTRTAV